MLLKMSGVNTEAVLHPLIASSAEARETVHTQYTLAGCAELTSIITKDNSITTSSSSSSAYFNVRPPIGSILDRQMLLELTVRVEATGGTFGQYFAPRQWPVNRAIDSAIYPSRWCQFICTAFI